MRDTNLERIADSPPSFGGGCAKSLKALFLQNFLSNYSHGKGIHMRIFSLAFALLVSIALARPAGADTVTITFQTIPSPSGSEVSAWSSSQYWDQVGSMTAYGGTQTIVFSANVTATQSTGTVSPYNPAFIGASITGVQSGNGTLSVAAGVLGTNRGYAWAAVHASFTALPGPLTGPGPYFNWAGNGNVTFYEMSTNLLWHGASFTVGAYRAGVPSVNTTGSAVLTGYLGGYVSPTMTAQLGGTGAKVFAGFVAQEVSRTFYDANPVPEPGTALLLGLGLAGLAGAGWRRRKA